MLPLSAPGVAATGSPVLSAGIILGAIPRTVVGLARRGQAVKAPPPRIAHFALIGDFGLLRARGRGVGLRRLRDAFLCRTLPPPVIPQRRPRLARVIGAARVTRLGAGRLEFTRPAFAFRDDLPCLLD